MYKERAHLVLSGLAMLVFGIALVLAVPVCLITAANTGAPLLAVVGMICLISAIFVLSGLFVVNPNEAAVLQLFGDYKGTVRREGMAWANPFLTKLKVSTKVRIVEGAVGMVEMALERLDEHGTVHLDEERKAAMVSNLLVVLCGERAVQPVMNTGTLYN